MLKIVISCIFLDYSHCIGSVNSASEWRTFSGDELVFLRCCKEWIFCSTIHILYITIIHTTLMHTLHKNVYMFAMCLSALAGYVDAVGFLHLSGYFISFMSGNSTRLAVSLIKGDMASIALLLGILIAFVGGTMLGIFVRHFSKPSMAIINVLGFVATLLLGAACSYELGWNFLAIALMILAMGAENAILQRNGEVIIGLTYMTGTLVRVGQQLAGSMLGGAKFAWVPYLLLWLGLIVGGMTGAALFYALGSHSLWIAAVWAAGLTMIAALLKDRLVV